MSSPRDRSNTALVVIDVQNDVVVNAPDRDSVVSTIAGLVERARTEQVPVVWVRHADEDLPEGSDGWRIVPELEPTANEAVVGKHRRDSFDGTTLEAKLSELGVGRLVVTGAQTDFCVRWTLHGAQARGYDTVLVADAHTTDDAPAGSGLPSAAELVAHTNNIWASQSEGRTISVVVEADSVRFS